MDSSQSEDLAHVRWLGGSPCSGKSSVARLLADRGRLALYSCDDAFGRHSDQATAAAQPTLYRIARANWDEIWMRPVEELLADVLAAYREEFPMILDDLRGLPAGQVILAEGAALMPALVGRRRAAWLVPGPEFQQARYPQRGAWVQTILAQCTYPQQAFANWMERDLRFSRLVAEQADALGRPLRVVDGRHTIQENAAWVARQLDLPWS